MTLSESSSRAMSPISQSARLGRAGERADPSWPWRRAGLLLSGAAQILTISAVLGVDPPALTWSVSLLAVAPAVLAGLAAVVPARMARLVVAGTVAVLVAGIAGSGRTGFLFVPALVALTGAAVVLWREQP
jgi:hypothetical protein